MIIWVIKEERLRRSEFLMTCAAARFSNIRSSNDTQFMCYVVVTNLNTENLHNSSDQKIKRENSSTVQTSRQIFINVTCDHVSIMYQCFSFQVSILLKSAVSVLVKCSLFRPDKNKLVTILLFLLFFKCE